MVGKSKNTKITCFKTAKVFRVCSVLFGNILFVLYLASHDVFQNHLRKGMGFYLFDQKRVNQVLPSLVCITVLCSSLLGLLACGQMFV